jgi:hypothetical protein
MSGLVLLEALAEQMRDAAVHGRIEGEDRLWPRGV